LRRIANTGSFPNGPPTESVHFSRSDAVSLSCDMLVFGGTGDLALHKLVPALYHLHRVGRLHDDVRILALARKDIDRDAYVSLADRHGRGQGARADFDNAVWQCFAPRLAYFDIDAPQRSEFAGLAHYLGPAEGWVRVHYLASAPNLF